MVKPIKRELPVVGQKASGRECGECTACCIHLDVDDVGIAHKAHDPCPKLELEAGTEIGKCGAYDARPSTCSKFECLWLQGFEDDSFRPDRAGFIMRVTGIKENGGTVAFNAIRAGALDAETKGWHAAVVCGSQVPTFLTHFDGSQQMFFPPAMVAKAERAAAKAVDAGAAKP